MYLPPMEADISSVLNGSSDVQFESAFLNKVGQPLLTLTFSEAMFASSGVLQCFAHLRFAGHRVHPQTQTRGPAAVILAGVTRLFWTACELPRWPVIRAHSPSEKRNPITEAGFTTSGPVCHWVSSHPPDTQMSIFML